ncbi:MAG TPA: low molecular weight phosphotyrosine protein phosphatase [Ruminococcaceae bacterium]|nr:low molecular weight phosphotyrosine protein phosphatase [Oscillospiraceae bacterium]
MKKVLFVCSGNICRSPMAEFVFREMARRRGLADVVDSESAGTNVFAPNSPVHNGTVRQLKRENIPYYQRGSRNIVTADYDRYDYLLGMERSHVAAMEREFGGDPEGKLRRLLDFTRHPRDIDDPWYTGDFETAYRDIEMGCAALLDNLFPGSREK